MSRSFEIEGIGKVNVIEETDDFALKIHLQDMKISRKIKFYSQDLLKDFFSDITESHAKDMAVATIKNKIELSVNDMNKKRK